MKSSILIIGTDSKWEEKQLKKSAEEKGYLAQILKANSIFISLNASEAELFYENKNITESFKNSRIIFRRTRGGRDKIIALSLIAQYWDVPFTDSVMSIMSNLNKAIIKPVSMNKIRQIPTVFLEKKATFDYQSLGILLPILVKHTCGRHGEGIKIFNTSIEVEGFLEENDAEVMLQPFLKIEEEYRIFVIGSQSLGVIKKIPEKGKRIANYAAGAQFLPAKIPLELEEEAIDICRQQKIEIGGVDIARVGEEYFLLEVNRCPEFRAFSRAKEVNVAEKIIENLTSRIVDEKEVFRSTNSAESSKHHRRAAAIVLPRRKKETQDLHHSEILKRL